MRVPEAEKELYTIAEVARRLAVSDETVRRMIKDGQLSAVKVRGQWRIHKESLDKYIKSSS